MDIGTAKCDSAIWLPVGTYQVTEYITYSKKGAIVSTLGAATNVKGDEFTIIDNEFTEGAIVPIKLSETAEYIKDYLALKEIWENLDGKNWDITVSAVLKVLIGTSTKNWICGVINRAYHWMTKAV